MPKKIKPKAKVNDVFFHREEEKMFIIDSVHVRPNGTLYTMREIAAKDPQYKRYYEPKLLDRCIKSKNIKAVKILYGRKK